MKTAPAPLYRDPIFDGPTDPTIIWNREEKAWWMIYTSRRANVPCHDVTWVHGTDLGVASSKDNGQTWEKVTDIDSSGIIWFEYSYPALIADGNNIYLTYTYKRSKIKYMFIEFAE